MKVILERRSRDDQAALAFEMYCYQARIVGRCLWVAALGGLRHLGFHRRHRSPGRTRKGTHLCWSFAPRDRLDHHLNRADSDVISTGDASPVVRVVTTDEELVIARHTQRILFPYGSE